MSRLMEAIRGHNYEQVAALIRQGIEINIADEEGMTPLHLAAEEGAVEGARLLIESGADIEARDVYGHNPVFPAAIRSDKVLEILLEHGADAAAEGLHGETALDSAAGLGCDSAIRLLLAHGKYTDRQLKSAFYACLCEHINLTTVFVEAGMEVRLPEAIILNDEGKIKRYLKGEVSSKELNQALVCAAQYSDLRNVRRLLKRGADPNGLPEWGSLPLVAATQNGRYWEDAEIIDLLLKAGADVNRRDKNGWSALSAGPPFFPFGDYVRVLEVLIQHGADVNALDPNGETAFMKAVKRGKPAEVRYLLEAGADVNAITYDGQTALTTILERVHTAMQLTADGEVGFAAWFPPTDYSEIIQLLLDYPVTSDAETREAVRVCLDHLKNCPVKEMH